MLNGQQMWMWMSPYLAALLTKPWAHFAGQTRFYFPYFYSILPLLREAALPRSRRTWRRFPRVIISQTYQYQRRKADLHCERVSAHLACIYSQLAPNYKLVNSRCQRSGEACGRPFGFIKWVATWLRSAVWVTSPSGQHEVGCKSRSQFSLRLTRSFLYKLL